MDMHVIVSLDRRSPMRRLIQAALVAVALCGLFAVGLSDASARQKGTVGWSDGTGWQGGYLIEQSVYPTARSIPSVTVTLRPKRPNRVAVLEFKSPSTGKWVRENGKITRNGRANLRINPICDDNQWCNGTFTYRVRVESKGREKGLVSKRVRVTYVPTPAEAAPETEAAPAPVEAAPPPAAPSPPASPFLGCRFNGKQLWGKIFVADYTWQADVKIAVVPYTWQADLRVQEVPYSWQATSCGKWAFVDYSWQADLKIAYVDYTWQADVKVASVAYSPGLN